MGLGTYEPSSDVWVVGVWFPCGALVTALIDLNLQVSVSLLQVNKDIGEEPGLAG